MKKTLLQKANELKKKKIFVPDKEMEEITLAWVRDEVTHGQVAKALGLNNTGFRVYSQLALTLKKYINNSAQITKPPKK